MAKKDELLNEKNTETSEVFNDKSLELRDMEELQEDFSSMFDDDIEETDAEEIPESFPTRPLFGRYSKPYGMIDEKIPAQEREKIPLLVLGSEVLWMIGGRINENYKVTSETKKILEIRYIQENDAK